MPSYRATQGSVAYICRAHADVEPTQCGSADRDGARGKCVGGTHAGGFTALGALAPHACLCLPQSVGGGVYPILNGSEHQDEHLPICTRHHAFTESSTLLITHYVITM